MKNCKYCSKPLTEKQIKRGTVCCNYTCALYIKPKKGWSIDKDGYKSIHLNSQVIKEHHFVFEKYYGVKIPKGYEIHHINKNRKDNRIENLTILTKTDHLIAHGMITKDMAINIMTEFLSKYQKHTIKEFESKMGYCVETITRKLGSWNYAKETCGRKFGI